MHHVLKYDGSAGAFVSATEAWVEKLYAETSSIWVNTRRVRVCGVDFEWDSNDVFKPRSTRLLITIASRTKCLINQYMSPGLLRFLCDPSFPKFFKDYRKDRQEFSMRHCYPSPSGEGWCTESEHLRASPQDHSTFYRSHRCGARDGGQPHSQSR